MDKFADQERIAKLIGEASTPRLIRLSRKCGPLCDWAREELTLRENEFFNGQTHNVFEGIYLMTD